MTYVAFISPSGGGDPPVGLTMFFAEQPTPDGVVTGPPVTERASFIALLSGVANEPFDGFSVGTSASLEITRNGTTCTVEQFVVQENGGFTDSEEVNFDVEISNNPIVGRFNTSGTSDRWLDCQVETGYDGGFPSGLWVGRRRVQFSFSTAVAFFGFYGTDFGDFSVGQDIIAILTDSDDVETTHIITDSGTHDDANLIFWGFVDDTKVYTKVVIMVDQAGGESPLEGLGVDDLVFGTPAYLA